MRNTGLDLVHWVGPRTVPGDNRSLANDWGPLRLVERHLVQQSLEDLEDAVIVSCV